MPIRELNQVNLINSSFRDIFTKLNCIIEMKRVRLLCFFMCFCSLGYAEHLRETVKPVDWESGIPLR